MAGVIAFAKWLGSARDGKWEFANGQAITTDAISTNVIDLGSHRADDAFPIDLGTGKALRFNVDITVAFAGGTSMDFQLITSDAADMLTSYKILASTGVVVDALLTAGTRLSVTLPEGVKLDRYLSFYCVDVDAHTAGTVDIYLAP